MYPLTPTLSVDAFQEMNAPVRVIPVTESPVGGEGAMVSPPHPLDILALHDAVVPPEIPPHDHVHGQFPVTLEGVPILQRFTVGIVLTLPPFAIPQLQLTGDDGGAPTLTLTLPLTLPPTPLQLTP